jgi:hypothetical protein
VLFADVVSYPGWSLCCVGCNNKVGEGFKDYEERSRVFERCTTAVWQKQGRTAVVLASAIWGEFGHYHGG